MTKKIKKRGGKSHQNRTMSSFVIARITGKQHESVFQDIQTMESAWEKVTGAKFVLGEYKDRTGVFPCYELKFDECMYVAAKWKDEPRAKLIKRWKDLEMQRVSEEQNPELSINKAVETYRKQGRTDAWIATRMSGIVQRNVYTKTLQEHDVKYYGTCTDEIYKGLFGYRAKELKEKNGLSPKANLREHMTMVQLSATMLSEALATESIEQKDIRGDEACAKASNISAKNVANAVRAGRKALGTT